MDDNQEHQDKHTDDDVNNNEDRKKPNVTESQDDDISDVDVSDTDEDEPENSDSTTNKVDVDPDNKETESDNNQTPEKENVAVAVAGNKNNKEESFDLTELSKITLGTNESDLSMESEETDPKQETNTHCSAPRRTRSNRRRVPTGGYVALNSGKKTGEKKDKQKPMKKKIQEKNIILHLENENKSLNEENSQLSEQNDSLHNENDQLTMRNDLLTQEINSTKQQLKETKENLQNEINKLKDEKKAIRREHKRTQERMEEQINQEKQMREAAENSKRILESALEIATKRNAEMESQMLRERRTHSSGATNKHSRPPKHRILLVGDSNARRVAQELQKENRPFKTEYIEAIDIASAKSWAESLDSKPDNTTVVLLVGTNDIRRGSSAAQCDHDHQEVTDILSNHGTAYAVIQAPLIYAVQLKNRYQEREVIKLNTRLEGRHKDNLISMEDLENDRSLMDKKDGIHLTTESSGKVALMIENHLKKNKVAVDVAVEDRSVTMGDETVLVTIPTQPPPPTRQDTPATPTTTTTTDKFGDAVELVETDARRAAKIIGQGGNRIEKFKLTHRVKVDTTYTDNKTIFLIRGKQDLTTKAKQELIKQLDGIKREDERRDQIPDRQINVTCRFYRTGYCRFGTRCKYRHDQGPTDIPTPSPHRPEQNRDRPDREDDNQREAWKTARKPENTDNRYRHDDDSDDSHTSPRRSWRPRPQKTETRPRSRSPLNAKKHIKERPGTSPKRHSTPKHRTPERHHYTDQQERTQPHPKSDPYHQSDKHDRSSKPSYHEKRDRDRSGQPPRHRDWDYRQDYTSSRHQSSHRSYDEDRRRRDPSHSPDRSRRRDRVTSEEIDSAIEILKKAKKYK